MKQGYLSQYFESVAAKRLRAVEINPKKSRQHELNGTKALQRVLGRCNGEKQVFATRFIWLGEENESVTADTTVTWYDSRREIQGRSECRLYFPKNDVTDIGREGDMVFIAKRTDDTLLVIITARGSTSENQLFWLFNIPNDTGEMFKFAEVEEGDMQLDFTVRLILDELGIEIEEPEVDRFDQLLERFQGKFPTTRQFSAFARETLDKEVDVIAEPDLTLIEWLEYEEKLFRRMERHLVDQRLRDGFLSEDGTDVEGFVQFSLSVHNRRKSRAGYALEHHLEIILNTHNIRYRRGGVTENRKTADFLFPGEAEYHNPKFAALNLTMLGVKTSCKDRWRQVLSEANRISPKHLLTLEPGISENQTQEMKDNNLQLVLPKAVHSSYLPTQQEWLMDVGSFISLVKDKQARL